MEKRIKWNAVLLWLIVVLASAIIILIGSKAAMKGLDIFSYGNNVSVRATVTAVEKTKKEAGVIGENFDYSDTTTVFRCRIRSGSKAGEEVTAAQNQSSAYGGSDKIKKVKKGDDILVTKVERSAEADDGGSEEWAFVDYYRLDTIAVLALAFAVLLILIGMRKGINALISLTYTALFVFTVFVPWILNGYNVYLGITATCLFTIVMSLLLIEGASRKSLVTIIGCCAGTGMAALITFAMNHFLHLTGLTSEHSIYITRLSPKRPIDLVGIVFAGIVIGALGAIMDVAMDISSSLYEIVGHVPDITFGALFKSGMRIGRDIMGTMANTLVLAYIGSSLCDIMLLFTYSASVIDLVNKEMVIVELLQALAGSLAILLTVPFTVIVAGLIYLSKKKKTPQSAARPLPKAEGYVGKH